ncbi:MAG: hypothetical protein PHU18_04065, partial [Dehalococcoidales bacterium]|nr:hypothetical protein [Dehalococcoidales bacterium]
EPKLIKEGSMYYIGVDYHKKYSYMVVKDQEGNLKDKGTVNNLQEEVEVRWTPCLGQGRGLIKREPCHPQGV